MSGTKACCHKMMCMCKLDWEVGSHNFKTKKNIFSILIEMLIWTQQAYRLPDISIKRQVWGKVEGPQTKHKTHILEQLIKQLHM